MIKVENIEVSGLWTAVRGARNPMNSHHKSDSFFCQLTGDCPNCKWDNGNYSDGGCNYPFDKIMVPEKYIIGDEDLKLLHKLYVGGPEHRKFARQIIVGMDVTTNQTLWSQLDTYKVGTTKDSCSKMHKIHVKAFEPDDFSHEGISEVGGSILEHFKGTISVLEDLRMLYNNTQVKSYWRAMIELLPMGYNLKATISMSYENVFNIINQRQGHKMMEWILFIGILKDLPYVREIMGEQE